MSALVDLSCQQTTAAVAQGTIFLLSGQFTEITCGVHLAQNCLGAGDARAHEVLAHVEY